MSAGLLKLVDDDPERELRFEMEFYRSLTCEERFRMVLEGSAAIAQVLLERGHWKPSEIFKRS